MPYDFEQESAGCTNELYYRNGPEAKDIARQDAAYVREAIERYLQEAFEAGRSAAAGQATRDRI